MSINQKIIDKFDKNIFYNAKLSNYSWFNLGGPAEILFKPENKKQLIDFFKENKKNKFKITILGAGSNTLIRDKGIKGVVIKLGSNFSYSKLIDENIIEVGAATLDRKIANFAKENGLGDLEFLSCIPDYDISKVLISVNVIDFQKCIEKEIKREDINFFYRGTDLSNDVMITSVKLKGLPKKKDEIEKKQIQFLERKKLSQPSQVKTCGSTFKNINSQKKAWKIIKDSGCEEFKEGDAEISKKHCNFFINNGKAKSSDIEKLIYKVKKTVNEKAGINLELEIKIIGD